MEFFEFKQAVEKIDSPSEKVEYVLEKIFEAQKPPIQDGINLFIGDLASNEANRESTSNFVTNVSHIFGEEIKVYPYKFTSYMTYKSEIVVYCDTKIAKGVGTGKVLFSVTVGRLSMLCVDTIRSFASYGLKDDASRNDMMAAILLDKKRTFAKYYDYIDKELKRALEIPNLQEKSEKLRTEITELQQKKDFLRQIGLIADYGAVQPRDEQASVFSGTFIDLISHTKAHMKASAKHLVYKDAEHIVERFLMAMFTNQLIILSGEPGSGKTSLPAAVAKAIGAECRIISVQPNWADNQDLLGYYNPIDRRYISTPFLEALMAARKTPEKIFFICLDEMNLAHIEYYFSGILSAMETEEKELRLYVGPNVQQLTALICAKYYPEFSEIDESQRDSWISNHCNSPEFADIIKQWNEAINYPPVIDIPDNVVFVGTLNMDETTKGISPKVLDRSYMIEISNNFDLNTQIDSFDTVEELKITPAEFKKIRSTSNRAEITEKKAEDPVELAKSIKNILDVWNKQAEHHKDVDGLREIHFSHRFLRQLAAMLEPKELSGLPADILAGKILPLMQCDSMPDKNRKEVKAEILKLCGSDSYIVDKFDRMARSDGQVNFWWR